MVPNRAFPGRLKLTTGDVSERPYPSNRGLRLQAANRSPSSFFRTAPPQMKARTEARSGRGAPSKSSSITAGTPTKMDTCCRTTSRRAVLKL